MTATFAPLASEKLLTSSSNPTSASDNNHPVLATMATSESKLTVR
jgi:hypothetical protein